MKGSWFQVRGTLSPLRGVLLTIASFLFPLIVWSFFAYTPGLWDVSHRLLVTTDLKNDSFSTIYRSDHIMEAERFQEFQQMVRDRNEQIRTYLKEGGELPQEIVISSRANQKVIRKLHPVGVEMGWLTDDQGTDNAALYQLWGELAEGKKKVPEIVLSAENQDLLRENWAVLGALGASYDSASFPSEPLLHLIPDGKRSIGRPSYLPAPHEVFVSAKELFLGTSRRVEDPLGGRFLDSVLIVFYGFLIACLVGVPIGILAGTFPFFSRWFEPFVDFFRYMPAPAFGTLLVFLLGSHDAPKIALVFLGTVCQAVLMTANTTRQLDLGLLDAAQTLGAKRYNLVFEVVIPGIVPNLYNDLRILLGWAWTWLVIAELMGVKSGLTEIIDTQGRRVHFDIVYATILLIGLTGFLTDQLLSRIRPVVFPWSPSA
ncbi:MAG: ABC transporter permease [Verrucomicrobiota bacterium]